MIAMPRFHKWFVDNIAGYMKSTMIENVRARNGIDGSFTTNQSESLNAELRRKVNYQPNELPDFLELMRQFYKSQESENQSAFVGEGDFLVSDLFPKFQAGESYYNMSIAERTAFEKRFYNSSPADSQKESLFDEITIPGLDADHSRNIVSKAERILEMDGVVPFSSSGSFHVINSEGSRPHYVVQNKDGSFTCDNRNLRNGCIGFNASNVCSHTYAAAKFSRKLQSFFNALERKASKASGNNLTNISHYGISEGAGKKAGAVRKRKQTQEIATTSPMLVNQSLKLRVIKHNGNHVAVPSTGKDYTLVHLQKIKTVRSCAGCPYSFARLANKDAFPPPDDIAICHKENAVWRDKATGTLRQSNKLSNRYYHVNPVCVRKGSVENKNFSFEDLDISTVDLKPEHKQMIGKNFGVKLA